MHTSRRYTERLRVLSYEMVVDGIDIAGLINQLTQATDI